jgi:hypothetical protein
MEWFTSLPTWLLVVGSLMLAVVTAFAGRIVVSAVVPTAERDSVHGVASPLMPALGALFAVMTALTLAGEAGYLRSAQDLVSSESEAASRLAWAATSPGVHSEPIHGALLDYLRLTRAMEWHDASAAEGHPDVLAAISTLERVVRAEAARAEPGTPASTELLTSVDAVTSGRRARTAAASRQIPVLYVVTLIAGGVALIANAGALAFRTSLRTMLPVVGLSIVVGLSVALLFALSAPWRGPLVVSGQPLDAVIRDLENGLFQP